MLRFKVLMKGSIPTSRRREIIISIPCSVMLGILALHNRFVKQLMKVSTGGFKVATFFQINGSAIVTGLFASPSSPKSTIQFLSISASKMA